MPKRETKQAKALRLLSQARMSVVQASDTGFEAEVRGDTGRHHVDWSRGSWHCTCPHLARTTACSHILAALLVWVPPETHEPAR